MGALVPYTFEGRDLRALSLGGEPWFVAGDAARFLGHREAYDLTRSLDDDEKGTHRVSTPADEKGPHSVRTPGARTPNADEKGVHNVDTPGGEQTVSIISEAGLYRAILQRRATKAVPAETRAFIARFQRWVFHDVLPAIRRTGAYAPEVDRTDLNLRLVAECRQTFDARAARGLWRDLGLPAVQLDEPPVVEGMVILATPSAPPTPAPANLVARIERLVRAAGPAGMTRTALYRRLDGRWRSSQLDAAMGELGAAGRVTATRPAGASLGRPQTTYRWCDARAS